MKVIDDQEEPNPAEDTVPRKKLMNGSEKTRHGVLKATAKFTKVITRMKSRSNDAG